MKRTLQVVLLVLFIVAIAVSLILSYFFSYRVIKPLEKLTGATKEFSKGNFREITGIRTGDEIEKLVVSFNDMGNNIVKMLDELEVEQQKQKKFLDNVTHEVRTPLTNIIGYADLSSRIADENQKEKYISYITGESNRLLAMVNSLLELSQLSRFEFPILKEETDLTELIHQALELMQDRAKKFGFDILKELDHVTVNIDREKIKQVIINLIDNAIKYSEGDTIEIKLSKGKTVDISVSDNGTGIPEEDIANITEPFYRVDKSRSRKLGGNGLGLAICKEIINAHDGYIVIESNENSGTIVTISLQP
jgi:signal transduction histidine kinase